MSQAILRQLTFGDTALFEIDSEKSQGTTIQFEIKQSKSMHSEKVNSSPQSNLAAPASQSFWQIHSPRFNMQMNALNLKEVQSDKVKRFIEERLKIHTLCKQQIDEEQEEEDEVEEPISAGLNRKSSSQADHIRQKLQRIHSIEEKFNSEDLIELDSASKIPSKNPSKARQAFQGFKEKILDAAKTEGKMPKFVDGAKSHEELILDLGDNLQSRDSKNKRSPEFRHVNSMEVGGPEPEAINPLLVTPIDPFNLPRSPSRMKRAARRKTTLGAVLEERLPSMWNLGDVEIAEQLQTKSNAKRLISLSITHTPEHNLRQSAKLSELPSLDRQLDRLTPSDQMHPATPSMQDAEMPAQARMNRTQSGSNRRVNSAKLEKPAKKVALVVDDEIMNTEIAKDIVSKFGLEVYTASNGDLALEICYKFLSKKKRIDIIFMDYSMPGMRGDQVTATLRESRFLPILSGTPIIGLTAHSDSETKRKCLASGMNKVEQKPFNVAKIRELLQEYKLADEAGFVDESSAEIRKTHELDISP